MYFDEDMMLDIRLNILNKFVSHFIICEAAFNHKGIPKKLNFNINNFSKFKDKISYVVVDKQPDTLRKINENDNIIKKNSKILDNALIRENYQRNYLASKLTGFLDDDLIIINDLDEIPNLNNFKYKNKITVFKQKMFYYKLNLVYPDFLWSGSKICKKKDLISPQWLRNIKSKKYPLWRLDSFFSKKKYSNINFIENGGWHFTNIKSAEQIDYKMRNFLHHLEYEESGISIEDVKKNIQEKKVIYDHFADKRKNKVISSGSLKKLDINDLPEYISKNTRKFQEWID